MDRAAARDVDGRRRRVAASTACSTRTRRSRSASPRLAGDVADTHHDGHRRLGRRRARGRRRLVGVVAACGGADAETAAATTTSTTTHDDHHDGADDHHHAAAADRAAHGPARPDRREPSTRPAVVGEGREHARRAPAGRARPGRRRLRGGRRGRHHPASSRCSTRRSPTSIGPVRSVRPIDPDIVWPLGGIFAFSGGAPVNVEARSGRAGHARRREQRRRRARPQRDRAAARARRTTCTALGRPLFGARRRSRCRRRRCSSTYAEGRAGAGDARACSACASGSPRATTRPTSWDAAIGHVEAVDAGRAAHRRSAGAQIAPDERGRAVHRLSPAQRRGQTVGEGDAWVFTDGTAARAAAGSRPDRDQPARYVDAAGDADPAAPGHARGSSCSRSATPSTSSSRRRRADHRAADDRPRTAPTTTAKKAKSSK